MPPASEGIITSHVVPHGDIVGLNLKMITFLFI